MTTRTQLGRVAELAAQAESARTVLAAGISQAVEDGRLDLPADLGLLVERYRARTAAWLAAVDQL